MTDKTRLRRGGLSFRETIALSVAVMAPTAAMALNGVFAAGKAGGSAPFAFLAAMAAIGLVAYAFVSLTRVFAHSGSVYGFNGVTLGPRAGFFSGWALLGTYFAFAAGSMAEAGSFVQTLLGNLGVSVGWLPVALAAGLLVWILAYNAITLSTRVALVLEGVSVLLILALTAAILVAVGHAGGLRLSPLTPDGHAPGDLAQAAVFGFLAFAGFEGAATLGEETRNPRRTVPLALTAAVVLTGVLYVVVVYGQTVGYGLNPAGIAAYASSSAPLDDLSRRYVGAAMASVLDAAATISALAGALGAANAAARVLYAMGRDGFGAPRLGTVSPRTGAPVLALAVVMGASLATISVWARDPSVNGATLIGYLGTMGTLSLLVAYALTCVGTIRYFRARRLWTWQYVVPILAVLALGYTLYSSIYPVPPAPYNVFPYVTLGWLLVGGVIVLASPALVRRIGRRLGEAEGLRVEEHAGPAPSTTG